MPQLMPSDLLLGLQQVMGDPLADELRRQQIQAAPVAREAQVLSNRDKELAFANLKKFLGLVNTPEGPLAEPIAPPPQVTPPPMFGAPLGRQAPPGMQMPAARPAAAPELRPELNPLEVLRAGVRTGRTSPEAFFEATRAQEPKAGAEDPALVSKYETQFLPAIAPLLERVKRDPAVATDIAVAGEKMGLGPLKRYQDFLNNVKGINPFAVQRLGIAAENRVVDLAWKYATQTDKQRTLVPGVRAVDDFFKDSGLPAGIYSSMDEIVKATPPGYGIGERGFRNFIKSDEATGFRSNILAIHAAWRNQLFGASLTDGERKAFEELSGTGTISNAKDLISGIRSLNAGLRENLRPVGGDDVMAELRNSGISTFEQLPEPPKKTPKATGGAAPSAGAWTPEKQKRLDELRAKKAAGKAQ